MTRRELKEQLNAILAALPTEKVILLVDFADFLRQQAQASQPNKPTPAEDEQWEALEQEIIAAQEYWFNRLDNTHGRPGNQTAAVMADRVLDSDYDVAGLAARIDAQGPAQPVLYLEAAAEHLPV